MTALLDQTTLVRAAQRGDAEAYGRLVRCFQDMAVGYAYSRLGDRHLAEDAAQEAFVAAFETLDQLRDPAAFGGWLRAVVHSCCQRLRRRRRREVALEAAGPVADGGADPLERLAADQVWAAVRGEIAGLPETERLAVTLSYMGNCSHRQVADFLGVPLDTVNNRLRAARRRLAARLRCPARRLLRQQAPSHNPGFARKVHRMIKPVEFDQVQPAVLPGGYTSTNAEVWAMLNACRDGDLESVRELTERCPGLMFCEYNYTPPIHFAVREGHLEVVRYLLERGADPTYRTYRFKDSLLDMARERGYSEIAALLEEALSARFPLSEAATALLDAAGEGDAAAVKKLLAADPSLARASDETGDTALHRACAGGFYEVARLLLEAGADIEAVRSDGFKPIHSAVFFNRQGWVRQQKPADALRAGRMAGLLFERGASYNILLAATFGDTAGVKAFLDEDSALANFEDSHHRRPLSAAAWRQDVEMVKLLLEHGADPSLSESDCPRGHAVWIAAFVKNGEMLKLLLEHGGDPEATAESGGRALDHVRDAPELFELLVAHGAQPKEAPRDVLHQAIHDDDLDQAAALLGKHPELATDPTMFWGEGIMALAAREQQRDMLELLIERGAQVPKITKWGCSYYFRHLDTARFFLDNGMDPDHCNWHGTTLLHDMAWAGDIAKAGLLLERGADIDAVDEEYRSTPLGLAARAGQKQMVEWLLERGADAQKAGAEWARPLAWAQKRGHGQIAALLERRIAAP